MSRLLLQQLLQGGGILSSAFTRSSLPQSLLQRIWSRVGNLKESLLHGLPCGRLGSNGATSETPSWETFQTETLPPLSSFTVGADSNIWTLVKLSKRLTAVAKPHEAKAFSVARGGGWMEKRNLSTNRQKPARLAEECFRSSLVGARRASCSSFPRESLRIRSQMLEDPQRKE